MLRLIERKSHRSAPPLSRATTMWRECCCCGERPCPCSPSRVSLCLSGHIRTRFERCGPVYCVLCPVSWHCGLRTPYCVVCCALCTVYCVLFCAVHCAERPCPCSPSRVSLCPSGCIHTWFDRCGVMYVCVRMSVSRLNPVAPMLMGLRWHFRLEGCIVSIWCNDCML